MTIIIAAEPVPLDQDENGTIRVRGSRVTLDTVIAAYNKGDTVEKIQQGYSELALADIYSIIAYYLHHQLKVEKYLEEQEVKAEAIRQKLEASYPTTEIRARLDAFRKQKRQAEGS